MKIQVHRQMDLQIILQPIISLTQLTGKHYILIEGKGRQSLSGVGPVQRAGDITLLAVSAMEIDLKQLQDCKAELLLVREIPGLLGSWWQRPPLTWQMTLFSHIRASFQHSITCSRVYLVWFFLPQDTGISCMMFSFMSCLRVFATLLPPAWMESCR